MSTQHTDKSPSDLVVEEKKAAELEAVRLESLRRLNILDTPPDDAFDRITELAARIFDVPIALVTLVDEQRQWFKSCWGLADYGVFLRETPREVSFCTHALAEHGVMVVPDATQDPRFADNPVVTGSPGVRFYAGAPVRFRLPSDADRRHHSNGTAAGDPSDRRVPHNEDLALGTLCLIDTKPRTFGRTARENLRTLASLVEDEFALRFTAAQLRSENTAKIEVEVELQRSQHRFQSAFEHSAIGMALVAPDGHWLRVNEGFCRLVGYSEKEMMSGCFQDITHPDDLGEDLANVQSLLDGKASSYQMQKRYFHRDGHVVWCQLDVTLVRAKDGTPLHFISQVQDLTARHAAEEQMQAARAEAERQRELANEQREIAEQANAAKSEFLSRMSHELRTPLNAILGFSQLLEMSEIAERNQESAQQISKAGRHLLGLINEVLDISRIESGSMSLSLEPVSLAEVAMEVLDLVRPLAASRGLSINDESVRGGSIYVHADRQRLRQALLNLVSNAVKYNVENGFVELTFSEEKEGRARIQVRDGGPGIAPEDAVRAFIPFERLGAEQSEIEGSGIGLPLSRRLVEAMGGELNFTSTPGEGCTFWIELQRTAHPIEPLKGENRLTAPQGTVDFDRTSAHATVHHSILYIEDNVPNLQLMEHIFEERPDWKLVTATDGGTGLEKARTLRPDAILLDVNLPDIQGDEVLEELQRDETTRDIPVIVVSAGATPASIARLRDAGATNYLTKPFNILELLHVIDAAISGAESGS
ncbi:MAG TPA: ATP-binding protein [Abditibacteriaceae bacterium]|jgi:hypothetical protein